MKLTSLNRANGMKENASHCPPDGKINVQVGSPAAGKKLRPVLSPPPASKRDFSLAAKEKVTPLNSPPAARGKGIKPATSPATSPAAWEKGVLPATSPAVKEKGILQANSPAAQKKGFLPASSLAAKEKGFLPATSLAASEIVVMPATSPATKEKAATAPATKEKAATAPAAKEKGILPATSATSEKSSLAASLLYDKDKCHVSASQTADKEKGCPSLPAKVLLGSLDAEAIKLSSQIFAINQLEAVPEPSLTAASAATGLPPAAAAGLPPSAAAAGPLATAKAKPWTSRQPTSSSLGINSSSSSRPEAASSASGWSQAGGYDNLDQAAILLSNSILVNTSHQPEYLESPPPPPHPAWVDSAPAAAAAHLLSPCLGKASGDNGGETRQTPSGLDRAAIILSHQIFLNTTEALPEEGEGVACFSMPVVINGDCTKDAPMVADKPLTEAASRGDGDHQAPAADKNKSVVLDSDKLRVVHAKQCYVVNSQAARRGGVGVVGSSSEADGCRPASSSGRGAVLPASPLSAGQSALDRPYFASSSDTREMAHRHRPPTLGPSRFDKVEELRSSSSLKNSSSPLAQVHGELSSVGGGGGGSSSQRTNKVTDSPTSILRSDRLDLHHHHQRPVRNVTVLLADADNRRTTMLPDVGNVMERSTAAAASNNCALAQSATFAYGTRPAQRPTTATNTGRNFNTSPIPFGSADHGGGGKYSVHFLPSEQPSGQQQVADPSTTTAAAAAAANQFKYSMSPTTAASSSRYGASVTFSESVTKSSGPSSPLSMSSSSVSGGGGSVHGSTASLAAPPSSSSSSSTLFSAVHYIPTAGPAYSRSASSSGLPAGHHHHHHRSLAAATTAGPAGFRARSEGAATAGAGLQSSASQSSLAALTSSSPLSTTAASAELFRQIQATKERHRENCEKALNFGSGAAAIAAAWKPPLIAAKLPRPGNDYARYTTTAERDKVSRRLERERSVLDRLLADRTHRAVSLENSRAAHKTQT